MSQQIIEELKDIKQLLKLAKKMLTVEDFCLYTGMSKQYAYYLTGNSKIRFSRPAGKMIYFDIDDVIEFLRQNPVEPHKDIKQQATNNLLHLKH
jgi:hypothetical protein